MKLLLLALAIGAGWYLYTKTQKTGAADKVVEAVKDDVKQTGGTAERYVSSLQNDVKKAEQAAEKANAQISRSVKGVKEALPDDPDAR